MAPSFDSRSRQGLDMPDDGAWRRRRKRPKTATIKDESLTIRPSNLKVRLPITIKNLALNMKLKASELLTKLF